MVLVLRTRLLIKEYFSIAWLKKRKWTLFYFNEPFLLRPIRIVVRVTRLGRSSPCLLLMLFNMQRLQCRRNTQLKPLLLQFHRHNAFHLQNSAPNRLHPLWFRHSHRHRQWRLLFPHWVPPRTLISPQKKSKLLFLEFSVFEISF